MASDIAPPTSRLRRLVEELADSGFQFDGPEDWQQLLLEEVDYGLRPHVHERRVPSYGAIVNPTTDPSTWEEGTQLTLIRRDVGAMPTSGARRFADGLSSWLIRTTDHKDKIAVFDRPAGSERDLVVLAEVLGATVIQRHPVGVVRVVGDFGVLRWDGLTWQHEPPISSWIDAVGACRVHGDRDVLETLLEFAVHDLGSRGTGAILIYRPDGTNVTGFETRFPSPPALDIRNPTDLAPLRHVLAQIDGAAVMDVGGVLRDLGVRLIPSPDAESLVASHGGMRHTSGIRYSYDDPLATVIVVSEDGPVTVFRNGEVLGRSPVPPS